MAAAIAEAGYTLHVWARRPASFEALHGVPHVRHDSTHDLGAACDIVGLCVTTDDDVMKIVSGGLLDGLRPGSVVVNHAARLTGICAAAAVDVLDAPVSGGRPAAEAKTLTTLVGGPEAVAQHCEPVFRSFSTHVIYLGSSGSGQAAKLFNNTLMAMNQANIADIVELAGRAGSDPVRLVEALKLGSASSRALTLLNTMITPATVEHLSKVLAEDMEIFAAAMADSRASTGRIAS